MASTTTFEYKQHLVIIHKHRGLPKYDIIIYDQNQCKVKTTMKEVELPLRKCKIRAKDYIGF
jgi:hypothetical protein